MKVLETRFVPFAFALTLDPSPKRLVITNIFEKSSISQKCKF